MYRRLLYSRIFTIFVGFICLTLIFNQTAYIAEAREPSIIKPVQPIYNDVENATFSMILSETSLTRGEDDLTISFQFTFENETYIPDSTIYFNITNPSVEVIYEDTLMMNISKIGYINQTIPWPTFNGQEAGNYTVIAIANSTFTYMYNTSTSFELNVLPFGRLRMYFPVSTVYLQRNQNNDVSCTIWNIGGTTVTNVTVTNEITKTGTRGSITRSISISNLMIEAGKFYSSYIGFFPEDFLYQKYSFTITYRSIDDPETERVTESDTLAIIVMPFISVNSWNIPLNATMGNEFTIDFEITNSEGVSLYILPIVDCDNIEFVDIDTSKRVTAGKNYLNIVGNPTIPGASALFFSIDLEWTTVSETKWYSDLLLTKFQEVLIISNESNNNIQGLAQIVYGIIFTALLLGLAYFSRDIFLGIVKRSQISRTRIFPELNYPFETVILDGSNIAWEEKSSTNKPKVANIEAMINRLSRANFKKIITVADAALRYQIDEQRRLDNLVKEGAVKMLPARVDGDKFILRLAEEENAMIVSNDMFKEFREGAPWIDERRIPYTILEGEVYLHPTSVSTSSEADDAIKEKQENSSQEDAKEENKNH